MGLSGKLLQIVALPRVIIISAIVAAAAITATIPKPDCPSKCGNVEIPFPFGLTEGCYLDESFRLTCHDSGKPKTGNVTVTNISIDTHELHVLTDVAKDCYKKLESGPGGSPYGKYCSPKPGRKLVGEVGISEKNGPRPRDPTYNDKDGGDNSAIPGYNNDRNGAYGKMGNHEACVHTERVRGITFKKSPGFKVSQYTISNIKNKFTVMGCDNIAYLSGNQNGEWYQIGCASRCPSLSNVVNGSCSGIGCCEVGFPDGLKDISVEVFSFNNHSNVWDFNPCGYAFIVEKGEFNFTADYLNNYANQTVPLVLDWSVGNLTCGEARNKMNFACQENSECLDRQTKQAGYRCKCREGYKGNPYLQGQGGCLDIDECADPSLNNCTSATNCVNTMGNYICGCPKWYHAMGTEEKMVKVVLRILD